MSPDLRNSRAGRYSIGGNSAHTPATESDVQVANENETALQRLAGDLCVAVPCLTLLALVFAVGTIHVAAKGFQTTEVRAREFVCDVCVYLLCYMLTCSTDV